MVAVERYGRGRRSVDLDTRGRRLARMDQGDEARRGACKDGDPRRRDHGGAAREFRRDHGLKEIPPPPYVPPRAMRSGAGPAAAGSEPDAPAGGTTITKRSRFPNSIACFSVATRRSRRKPLTAAPQSSPRSQPSPSIHTHEP